MLTESYLIGIFIGMKFEVYKKHSGCERLIAHVTATHDGKTIHRDIEFLGNYNPSAYWGALKAIEAVNEILEDIATTPEKR